MYRERESVRLAWVARMRQRGKKGEERKEERKAKSKTPKQIPETCFSIALRSLIHMQRTLRHFSDWWWFIHPTSNSRRQFCALWFRSFFNLSLMFNEHAAANKKINSVLQCECISLSGHVMCCVSPSQIFASVWVFPEIGKFVCRRTAAAILWMRHEWIVGEEEKEFEI